MLMSLYGKSILSDNSYMFYLYFISIGGLYNYFLFGAPDYVILKVSQQTKTHVISKSLLISFTLISIIGFLLYVALAILVMHLSSIESLNNAIRMQLVFAPLQSCIIFQRSILEGSGNQIYSVFIRNVLVLFQYAYPVFTNINQYVAVNILIQIGVIVIFFRTNQFYFDADITNWSAIKLIISSGAFLNSIWMYTQLVPIIDKVISNELMSEFNVDFAFFSDMLQRMAIIYGTLGQFHFPYMSKLTREYHRFERTYAIQIIIMFLFSIAMILFLLIDVNYTKLHKLLPTKLNDQPYAAVLFLTVFFLNSIFSLSIRPIYIIGVSYLRALFYLLVGLLSVIIIPYFLFVKLGQQLPIAPFMPYAILLFRSLLESTICLGVLKWSMESMKNMTKD
jgi:hypothetical protein